MFSFKPTTPDSRRMSTSTPRIGSASAIGSPAIGSPSFSTILATAGGGARGLSSAILGPRSPGAGIRSPAPPSFSSVWSANVAGGSPNDDNRTFTEKFYAEHGGEDFVEQFVSLPHEDLTKKLDLDLPAVQDTLGRQMAEYKEMTVTMEREMNAVDGKIIEARQTHDAKQEALEEYFKTESAKLTIANQETIARLEQEKAMSLQTIDHAQAKLEELKEHLGLANKQAKLITALLFGPGKPYSKDSIVDIRRDLGCPYPEDIDTFSRVTTLLKLRKCSTFHLDSNKDLRRRFQEEKAFQELYGKQPKIYTGKAHRVDSELVDYTADEVRQRLKDYLCFGIIATDTGLTLNDDENKDPQLQAELREIAQQAEERMQSARKSARKRRSSRGTGDDAQDESVKIGRIREDGVVAERSGGAVEAEQEM